VNKYLKSHSGKHTPHLDQLSLKLEYLAKILNHPEIRSIFFVYFHELINRYSFEDHLASQNEGFYLSEYFQALVNDMVKLPSYQHLLERKDELGECDVI